MLNQDMSSKMDTAFHCIGGTPEVSAMQKIRALAMETGLAQLGYPIHLIGPKVMKIVPDVIAGTSFEKDSVDDESVMTQKK